MKNSDIQYLTNLFHSEGIAGIESHLPKSQTDGQHRLTILESIRKSIAKTYIADHSLDSMHDIYEACILEALADAENDKTKLDYANVTSYNLAANLADCWDDADQPRFARHFSAGVKAANRCLDLRTKLEKPPAAFAMAYFILGVHEYALQHYALAEKAWVKKLDNERLDQQDPVQADSDLNTLLSHGLIGLARWSQGTENDKSFTDSILRLEDQRNTTNSGEIDLFVAELRLLKEKHGPT